MIVCQQLGLAKQNCLQCWVMNGRRLRVLWSYCLVFQTVIQRVSAVSTWSEISSFANWHDPGRFAFVLHLGAVTNVRVAAETAVRLTLTRVNQLAYVNQVHMMLSECLTE